MMNFIRDWLLGVTGVAILTAMAESLMPEGPVKRVGKLVGGLVLLVAILSPILALDLETFDNSPSDWSADILAQTEALDMAQKKQYQIIIENEFATYIVDKASAEGIVCRATVTCQLVDDILMPSAVSITGIVEPWEKSLLISLIVDELGVPQTHIIITEEDMGERD